jgi:polyisoprenoid-binding protein YceI
MITHTESLLEPGTWRIDTARSRLGFTVRHLRVATVRGRFARFGARIDVDEHGLHVDGAVDAGSVDTGQPVRDARLRAELFDTDRFPLITFTADGVERVRRGHLLRGELTIRDVTRPVELRLSAEPVETGGVRLRAEGELRRSDFGLDWEALREAGRLLVADRVRIVAEVEAVRAGA